VVRFSVNNKVKLFVLKVRVFKIIHSAEILKYKAIIS